MRQIESARAPPPLLGASPSAKKLLTHSERRGHTPEAAIKTMTARTENKRAPAADEFTRSRSRELRAVNVRARAPADRLKIRKHKHKQMADVTCPNDCYCDDFRNRGHDCLSQLAAVIGAG